MARQKITYSNANRALKDIEAYLDSISNVFRESRNLKLYDVAFQGEDIIKEAISNQAPEYKEALEKDLKLDDVFCQFCDNEYDFFLEYLKENNIKDCREYIGRTSNFYLTNYYNSSTVRIVDDICGIAIERDSKGRFIPYIDDASSYKDSLEADRANLMRVISGEALKDVKEAFSDAVEIAGYIDSFKENQVDAFKHFVEGQVDIIIWGIEIAKESERQARLELAIDTACAILV